RRRSRRADGSGARTCIPVPCACSGTYRVWSADWSLHTSRPAQAQCSQRIDVDLRVNSGGVVALMPQQLSDLRQGRARSEKLGSETVSEDMGAAVCATFDSNAIKGGLGDHGDRTSGSKADVWRECADEQPTARRLWAAIAQICND